MLELLQAEPLYELHGDQADAGGWARGPWDENAQHGGPTAAILMRAMEGVASAGAATGNHQSDGVGLQLARVTYELIHPAPLGRLRVHASLVRPGRRIQLLEAALIDDDGIEVVKARALWVARAAVEAGGQARPRAPGPEELVEERLVAAGRQMYVGGGIEVRMARGHFREAGPAFAWLRLKRPLVAGEQPSALQRVVAAADFPNGIAAELSWDQWVFINPDLTVYLEREPRGEWIGLDAHTRVAAGGVGVAEAVMYDRDGRIGRSLQSLYVARRPT